MIKSNVYNVYGPKDNFMMCQKHILVVTCVSMLRDPECSVSSANSPTASTLKIAFPNLMIIRR